ncbi:glycosyltransferase family 25 protein [Vibrio cholerae]|uniref:GT99 family glycosyltransferase N-terminal domain-containing protein n=1 Tax=Vibrio cholerae TaxID=666 RepID=UPI001C92D787|nr:glycosyltransferase family 25 protein [Vibrio cholerae]MBY4643584.1 glycosyltransferase family 25 protein [Vibrio cholerae]MCR9659353.1 glycosyltransferase family 25 protein [Vibrio cholerae]MCR9692609.1 glycosyltransferase family 25 protein [Vibrio cholerae]MCR9738590.1 glycosyltransferase family 25 protein [Vibrio cholerae]MCR9749313.1 glycosyltransferase family 25 protein [Vibrio cholerae]
MLAAFLPPYPFRVQAAPYLWLYYRLLYEWEAESAFFLIGRDYVRPPSDWEDRWECDPAIQSRLGYSLPLNTMPEQHHYAWLDENRFDDWLNKLNGNPIEAFRCFLCERDAALERELEVLLDAAPDDVEAIVTICNVASLEAVCAARGIPVIHIELGPLRAPLYRETGYVDFRGVNGNSESAQRYSLCDDWQLPITTRELLHFFLTHPEICQKLPVQSTYECGVVLQVEDDSNLVAYGNGMSNLALLAAARQKVAAHDLLVRAHPGSSFSLKSGQVCLDNSPNSLCFVALCRQILTINSSVGLEAILLDKSLTVWGDNSYNFILESLDDAERTRRLSFYLLGYLVPFSLQLKPGYLRFRLGQPEQHDIILCHMSEYMQQDHLDPKIFNGLPSSAQAAVSIQFANLVRAHQADERAWQERNTELVTLLSEQSALHAKQVSDYEAEIARQYQEFLSIIEEQQKSIKEAQQQAALKQKITTSLSWRITMPLRVIGRLLRGDVVTLQHGWRQVCSEGGRRGKLARAIRPLLRPMVILARDPALLKKGWRSLRYHGVRKTLNRISHVLGRQSHYSMPVAISLGNKDTAELVILTTTHCGYLAELMCASLKKVNIQAVVQYQMPEEGYFDVLHIVICPQMFPVLPGQYIVYQLEQSVSSRWFTDDYLARLENSLAIFDYSLKNIVFLQNKGLNYRQIYHLPVGLLPRELANSIPETVDVLFYGDINNDRRRAYVAELKKHFSVKIINDLFGDALYAEMSKAKVIVNIHYYEGALLETTRIYECLSQNKIIVSEESADMDEHSALLPLVDFVPINNIDEMVERVRYWVSDDVRRNKRSVQLRKACVETPDVFSYYFLRAFLAHDLITYEQFYTAVGDSISFDSDMVCLGLPETVSRRADFDNDNHYGIQYFPGLRHRLGWVGCGLSYKFLLHRAKDLGLERIMICEDDIEFPENFLSRLKSVNEYLNERKDWDLFSGLIANLHQDTNILACTAYNGQKYVTIDKMTSTVMNIYSRAFYEKLLGWDDRNHDAKTNTIDRYIESRSDLHVITTPKFLVGHKEELDSTLWGFNNSTYREMIAESERLLGLKLDEFSSK